jgi:pantetheine-phosphate adenylyltransferase
MRPVMATAIYPGTFDPVTNGHLDILHRACQTFDQVVVGVAPNALKNPLFTAQERIELIAANVGDWNVEVRLFEGLVVDFARKNGASVLIRGLRAVSDFEFEFQMTQMNRDLDPGIETIFLMPGARYFFTSSTIMKQVAYYDPERIAKFVPLNVAAALKRKFDHQ